MQKKRNVAFFIALFCNIVPEKLWKFCIYFSTKTPKSLLELRSQKSRSMVHAGMEIVEIVEWVSNFLNVPCALAVQVVLGFQVSEVMTMCNEAWLGFYKWSRNHFHQFQFLVVVAAWVLSGEAEGSGLYH